jgi:hypothetical protein
LTFHVSLTLMIFLEEDFFLFSLFLFFIVRGPFVQQFALYFLDRPLSSCLLHEYLLCKYKFGMACISAYFEEAAFVKNAHGAHTGIVVWARKKLGAISSGHFWQQYLQDIATLRRS